MLLLDTTNRPDIAEYIKVHQSLGPGDVRVQWAILKGKSHQGKVALLITTVRPMEVFMAIEFDIAEQGLLVEQTLAGGGLYICIANGDEDRLLKDIHRAKVLLEVPDTGFGDTWNDLFRRHVTQKFRTLGHSRAESRQAARLAIDALRSTSRLRIPDMHE